MMNINNLTLEELELLKYCLEKHSPELLVNISELDNISVENETIVNFTTAIGMEIAETYLPNNPESHEYMIRLDKLISRLSVLYLWRNGDR